MSCDGKPVHVGVVGAWQGRKAQREHDAKVAADAVRAYVNQAPQPAAGKSAFDRATDKGNMVLRWVAGLWAASLVGTGAAGRALGLGLQVLGWLVLGVAVLGFAGLVWHVRSVNRREALAWAAPAPEPRELTPAVREAIARGWVPAPVQSRQPAAIRARHGAGMQKSGG